MRISESKLALNSYPLITDVGFCHFIDAISRFPLKKIVICLGTTETSTTVNITDEVIKKICRAIIHIPTLEDLEINFKHRLSVSNESITALNDSLPRVKGLKRVHVYLEGTRVDPLYTRQLEKILKKVSNIPDVLITV